MEVYLLRHGETSWNHEKKIQGSTEWVDLTDRGIDLAIRTRDGMLAEGVTFDKVFSSPLRRALHTARIVGEGMGQRIEVDDRLREMSFGRYEGTLMEDGRFADSNIRACFKDPPMFVPDGGESFNDLLARARSFVEEVILPLEDDGIGRVLVVSHGAIMRSFVRLVTNRPLEDYWLGSQPNCCVHVFEVLGGRCRMKEMAKIFAAHSG